MARQLSLIDKLVVNVDQALRALVPNTATATRENPANKINASELNNNQFNNDQFTNNEQKHIAGLMRVNHTGEVCAQALYQGQALTAKLPTVRRQMEQAAQEEIDHLVWCEQRLQQLDSHTSVLNPAFYIMSFALGAGAGLIGDKWSLGFIAATEDQVCQHLQEHLQQLPDNDEQSRVILQQMLEDEAAHSTKALEAGGYAFSTFTKKLMSMLSKVMTQTTYRI